MATKVDYNFLGRSGVKVSNLCLGAMTFGSTDKGMFPAFYSNPRQLNEEASHQILDKFVELGGNFIDTADIYANGNSEKIIGTWLQNKSRDDIVIASKAGIPMDMTRLNNGVGLSRRHIVESLGPSLDRLQTNYLDLYQGHVWDNGTPLEETLRTFDDLVRCGKIRYYGFSNVCGWQLQKIADTAKMLNLNPCITLQQQYSLCERDSELEAFQVCQNEGIAVLPWSPLKGGLLTDKLKRDVRPDPKESRAGYLAEKLAEGKNWWSPWDEEKDNDNYWKTIDVLKTIAKDKDKSVAQVALRWLIQQEVVSSVIIGCTSVQQLEDNMGASSGWELSPEEMKQLSDAAPLRKPYPYGFISSFASNRTNPFARSVKMS
ncbi:1-deoxyxylulose-5-phosphate synthase YajO-like [Dreissena polymorpha]|uniref:NADP-dependent oxidoreductase domain-containing protein n=1 Tax=Dreissena polymorpha TaxID=45954 RepID=A0A9D4F0S3_DREPO|nr:1-deoxyxylulose-5-phosphate synthase YajO-like [Dreissena polymorpha]XP_052226290.1 1-deoxyxylulose-5-phosphate synthase YajO-like [Dreissena polymorpha]XP_052226291.1 1-deoxyxylulose-5-phosphate synthase YajO-like [Dreissena polymorpha]XP_052226292.1 1-deoxyxylulose-5-phosphate synthase YajO-like [Dreissena polymorpha]KAH3787886.1 hypothetical protein DPMN_166017 [Dreissena polymorpha]